MNQFKKPSRRFFIKNTASAAILLSMPGINAIAGKKTADNRIFNGELPWYNKITRWGQVNITEQDPPQYDITWWRNYWKRTATQGIIANAGGIVAYYPTQIPLHRKAEYLQGRDLFGELCKAAHEDGLAVFARMDSNRAHAEFYQAHPGWFAIDVKGNPYKADDLYISCINSPYYDEHIPAILKEIAMLYKPEGFTDNSWSGLGRDSPCYCEYCQKSFKDKTGYEIPKNKNWNDKAYKQWIKWNYERRLEIWGLNNSVTKSAGGPSCIWSGMNGGSISGQSKSFRDFKAIAERADIIMLDDQARSDSGGFQHNSETGKLIHGILGWNKLIPESMAMYQAHKPWFRLASKPEPEARMWMTEGLAGGIQPWWHIISAYHEDRRMYHNPEAVFRWHKANEEFLVGRMPIATVGVVWSQLNTDFYGQDSTEERVELPWRGITEALVRARIPYLPVHIDSIEKEAESLSVLILPNLGVMTDEQVAKVKRFVNNGGNLIATGDTSLFDEWGDLRTDFALADIFGVHSLPQTKSDEKVPVEKLAGEAYHTYLRLTPELRRQVDGPHKKDEPPIEGKRHEILKGFEETDIIPFGGLLSGLRVDEGAQVLLTFIPQFPVYPPEKAWMRVKKTGIPGLVINTNNKGSRIAYLAADIDKQYGRSNLPDHGNLLKNIVLWAAKDELPIYVKGSGLVDVQLYRQPGRLVLHLVNLTNENTWKQPLDELIAIGPLEVKVKLPGGINGNKLRLLVSGAPVQINTINGWCQFTVRSILDHEVVVIT